MNATGIDHAEIASAAPAHARADVSSYLAIHRAMRTANAQLVGGLVNALHYDPRRVAALRRWFAGYAAELRTHHFAEDEIVFPALAERSPEFAALNSSLDVDHHRLDEIIDALDDILTRWAAITDMRATGTLREDAIFYAVELRDLLAVHLDIEDTRVIPLIQEHFTAEEYAEVERRISEAMPLKHAFWTVPWVVATFDAPSLEQIWSEAPAMLKVIYYLSRRSYRRLTEVAFAGSTNGSSSPWLERAS